MANINFDCPHCGQNLDAPDDMVGWAIDCPACENKIKIPIPEGAEPPAAVDTTKTDEKATTGLIENPVSAGEDTKKGSTVRIDVPEEYLRPPPSQRIVKIKRVGK